jgi:glycosyltransferase involved in cell wall biosynthesis
MRNKILKRDLDFNLYLPEDLGFFDTGTAEIKIDFKKHKSKPVFSVIIPTFNKKSSLRFVLDNLFKQDYPKSRYEIIVIDDGSNDKTLESVKKIKPTCNFKYFYWPRKRIAMKREFRQWAKFYNRVGLVRNIGVENSNGEIILFNDADILTEKDCLKKHHQYHLKESKIIVRGFRMLLPKGAGFDARKKARPEKPEDEKILHCRMHNLTQEGWHRVVTSNLSIRKKHLEKVGGFSRDFIFWGFEDADLGYRLSKSLKLKFIWDANIKVYHFWHPREAGNERRHFLAFKTGASIMYNKYLDDEIISVFNEAARRRFKKQYEDFVN